MDVELHPFFFHKKNGCSSISIFFCVVTRCKKNGYTEKKQLHFFEKNGCTENLLAYPFFLHFVERYSLNGTSWNDKTFRTVIENTNLIKYEKTNNRKTLFEIRKITSIFLKKWISIFFFLRQRGVKNGTKFVEKFQFFLFPEAD